MWQRVHLLAFANGELVEAPLLQAGVDAFPQAASLEEPQ